MNVLNLPCMDQLNRRLFTKCIKNNSAEASHEICMTLLQTWRTGWRKTVISSSEFPWGSTPLPKLSLMRWDLTAAHAASLLPVLSPPLLDDREFFVAAWSRWKLSFQRQKNATGVPAAAAAAVEGGAPRLCRSCRPACIYDVLSLQAAAAARSCRRYWCACSWKRGHTQSQFHYSSSPSVIIPQREAERGFLIKAPGSSLWPGSTLVEECLYILPATWNAYNPTWEPLVLPIFFLTFFSPLKVSISYFITILMPIPSSWSRLFGFWGSGCEKKMLMFEALEYFQFSFIQISAEFISWCFTWRKGGVMSLYFKHY